MKQCSIQDHGLIGNLQTAALVSTRGVIDFFCHPEFDSPSVFASLLDPERGGYFQIEPQPENARVKQLYLPETNILLTRFLSESGVVELTDFMPLPERPSGPSNRIIRHLEIIRGKADLCLRCAPRFNYGRTRHAAKRLAGGIGFYPEDQAVEPMILFSSLPLELENGDALGKFSLAKGDTATFSFGGGLDENGNNSGPWTAESYAARLKETGKYWRDWIGQSKYRGRWQELVNRSGLTLKLCSNHKHGCLIAAPTFGLPEKVGGKRNWDYRFTWLRDSAFTLYAFLRLGMDKEPQEYAKFLHSRITEGLATPGEDGPLRPMYRIDGSSEMKEVNLEHLSGYARSRPVRVGNGAQSQLQLDVYGELLDAIYLATKYGNEMSNDGWNDVCALLAWLQKNWQRPDQGIWEVRKGPEEFLHSRLMCWVAFDRATRLARKRSLAAPLGAWLETRDAIHRDIFENFWSDKLKSFTQTKGGDLLDASVLLMPLMRFISPRDPCWLSTMAAIEADLTEDGLVHRYQSGSDGLEGNEGTFSPCSFWLIECVARTGQIERAHLMFEKMLEYGNHLGLYSEQLGPSGEQLGNFPQALTHLALISAATYLDRKLSDAKNEPWQ